MLEINRENIADASELEKEQQAETVSGQKQGDKKLQKNVTESECEALNRWSDQITRTQDLLFEKLC
jgi:hypothetical protein